ncbi:DUF3465 domain-containing protein [Acinetobacter nectaris]|uniref:DUF3465 domain-containing protein n=1 Tax=Acinetobacter nectaris TaxID=1219382 RepID=UPI001F1B690E|nr:DUF3465 domain-containing protein [Acinetobacter nectaris]MCF8998981.1 DUF3465 domain-containing protein [Acinetobacter nectaris]MCF9027426.1 DUF3465 domain-containing protein [Acinetobacter nectaris]
MNKNKNIIIFIVAILIGVFAYKSFQKTHQPQPKTNIVYQQPQNKQNVSENQTIQQAYKNHQSNVIVEGEGVVKKVLRTDNEGVRHQKLILDVGNKLTILVAHNIDLASEIPKLAAGETVKFKGEYEYNEKGGVLHWTHKDPRQKHEDGWLNVAGTIYQ